ncbi:MAG: group 1 glycosyl [Prolixibacteraceae bacterium]|nr:MAG: group 1 glycosyl [Prolixibacteraceae bacterium]
MKSKVLFILHWPPPVHGSSVVGLQIKESKIINENFDCCYINLGTSISIDEIGKNSLIKFFRHLTIIWKVLRNLVSNRPALCYFAITAKGNAFYKDALVVLLVKIFRVKLVYHFHNKGVSTRQNRFIDNLLYGFVFKNTDVILLSKYLYTDIQSFIPEKKVHICPNGISKLDKPPMTLDKKQNQIVNILFLSNLIESKGVFVLLAACSILLQKGITFKCDFVGGEGDINADQFQTKVRLLRLTNHVRYFGLKYGEEKNRAFCEADIFALPTSEDCFPLVLLEAMQNGLPIVSTFEGGIKDIVEDNVTGYLVQQKNVQSLAAKLELLIQNSELRINMGKAGRLKYEQEFTLIKFENRLMEILNQLVSK